MPTKRAQIFMGSVAQPNARTQRQRGQTPTVTAMTPRGSGSRRGFNAVVPDSVRHLAEMPELETVFGQEKAGRASVVVSLARGMETCVMVGVS